MSRKNKKYWGLEDLLSVVGFVFELVRVVVNALRKRGGTVDHLRRLLKEPGLVDKVFDLIVVAEQPIPTAPIGGHPYRGGSGESSGLLPDHYRAFVPYGQFPNKAGLEPEFSGEGSVSSLFDGRPWEQDASRTDVDRTPGERDFYLKEFDHDYTKEEAIAWGEANDYWIADHEEGRAFALAQPEFQRLVWIVLLGSSALGGAGRRFVGVLGACDRRRLFFGHVLAGEWHRSFRALFVRKSRRLNP